MTDDGYVKFQVEHRPGTVPWTAALAGLDGVRTELFDLGMIGVYPNGIGYGNLSLRDAGDTFIITGTATGARRELGPDGWCRVDGFSAEDNRVRCSGPIAASSESMTHGTIYQALSRVGCIIHVHHRRLFDAMLAGSDPRTAADVPYGTPAMAAAVAALVRAIPEPAGLFAMAGHDEGVVAYGPDPAAARHLLLTRFLASSGALPGIAGVPPAR